MADSKITALTALTAADPANDMFPVVDVSDTSMAASGTTKRISINNILACSPSATLASATITGALGAAGLNVTGSTIPANGVYLGSANNLSFSAASTLGMTLNSTGLGVGGSVLAKISAYLTSTATYNSAAAGDDTDFQISRVNNSTVSGQSSTIALNSSSDNGASVARVYLACVQESNASYASSFTVKTRNSAGTNAERLRIDSSGNVGISRASTGNKLEAPGVGIDGRATVGGVSTVATTIYTIKQSATAAMCVVFGDDGSNGFCDIVLFLATVAPKVVSSQTLYGSPAARTYSASTTNLQLALASGSLSIRTAALSTLNT